MKLALDDTLAIKKVGRTGCLLLKSIIRKSKVMGSEFRVSYEHFFNATNCSPSTIRNYTKVFQEIGILSYRFERHQQENGTYITKSFYTLHYEKLKEFALNVKKRVKRVAKKTVRATKKIVNESVIAAKKAIEKAFTRTPKEPRKTQAKPRFHISLTEHKNCVISPTEIDTTSSIEEEVVFYRSNDLSSCAVGDGKRENNIDHTENARLCLVGAGDVSAFSDDGRRANEPKGEISPELQAQLDRERDRFLKKAHVFEDAMIPSAPTSSNVSLLRSSLVNRRGRVDAMDPHRPSTHAIPSESIAGSDVGGTTGSSVKKELDDATTSYLKSLRESLAASKARRSFNLA